MLILRDLSTGNELSLPVNAEQLVVVPDCEIIDLQSDNDAVVEMDRAVDSPVLYPSSSLILSDSVHQFGKYRITCLAILQQHQLHVSMSMSSIFQLGKF